MDDRGKFLRFEPCAKCGSKDNVGVWAKERDGTTYEQKYCFSCAELKSTIPSDVRRVPPSSKKRVSYPPRKGGYGQLANRRLTQDTCAKYKVWSHGPIVYLPSVWEGEVLGYKVRDFLFAKSFKKLHMYLEGDYTHFFGWQAVHTKNIIAIAYGEFDAMAVFEATGIPCLSPPSGDRSLPAAIKKDWERLAQFEKIVLLPDQDKSGARATEEAIELLGEDRCHIATLAFEDPNAYLFAGKPALLKQDFYAAASTASKLFVQSPSELIMESESTGVFSGIGPLDRSLQGFRSQEATYILGAPSHGKTTFVQNLLHNLIDQKIKVGALVLEGTHKKFVTKLACIMHGGNIHNANPEDARQVREKVDTYFTLAQLTGRTTSVESLTKTVTAAVKAMDCKFLVIDNITGASDPTKFFESSSQLVMAIDDLVTSLDVHLFVVSHVGRGNYEEPPRLNSGLGSGHIERFGYNIIGVHLKDNITRLEVLKNREHGHSAHDVFYGELSKDTLRFRFFQKNDRHKPGGANAPGNLPVLGQNFFFPETN